MKLSEDIFFFIIGVAILLGTTYLLDYIITFFKSIPVIIAQIKLCPSGALTYKLNK